MNKPNTETVPSSDLQRRTRAVLNAVVAGGHIRIERWGQAEAVLVPVGWYEEKVREDAARAAQGE